MRRFNSKVSDAGLKHGWRSGLEEQIGEQLKAAGINAKYEELRIPFEQPAKPRHYTPDWVLPNGIVIESKGRFVSADRQKHLLVQAQYPKLDIRFVFSNSKTRISKQSKTIYAAWAQTKGFRYADKFIPEAWLKEPKNHESLAIINTLRGQ
jgi:Autographiviridae endonuclease I